MPSWGPETSSLRRRLAVVTFAVFLVLLSACSASGGASKAHASTTSSSSGVAQVVITSTYNPSLDYILTDAKGMTLYHYAPERDGEVKCRGSCARTWPPLTVASGVRPVAGPGIRGSVATTERSDGSRQVTFNGLPLYRYSKDSHRGEASGEGKGGLWTVIEISPPNSSSVTLHPLAS